MVKNKIILLIITILFVSLMACKKDTFPKPSGYLNLEYPEAEYVHFKNQCPFEFDMNYQAVIKGGKQCDFTITYPKMKATIYLTYKPVQNNINELLKDAQKLTYEHVIKADDILEQPYRNPSKKVYGMFYRVNGNAATNSQFYVTDSVKNFITGSVYFYAKPNFDSVMPASSYVQNDMQRLMETIQWK